VIYAQLENEIEWAKNEELVKYVMLVLVPKKNSDVHIDILKDISTKLINEDFRKKLENVKNISEIYEVLNV
ncbi:MAG: PTS sugar transporter subunit IIA, partial [Lactobacillus iners]|nr:PTS sugar transporter subunit IIA [Lactobacillus iners]